MDHSELNNFTKIILDYFLLLLISALPQHKENLKEYSSANCEKRLKELSNN